MYEIELKRPSDEELKELGIDGWSPWGCDVGSFDWEYDCDEECFIFEGKVKVKTPTTEVEINKGDLVRFPKGLKCTWMVLEPIRKVYRFD